MLCLVDDYICFKHLLKAFCLIEAVVLSDFFPASCITSLTYLLSAVADCTAEYRDLFVTLHTHFVGSFKENVGHTDPRRCLNVSSQHVTCHG